MQTPINQFDIRNFGAVADGRTINTEAIQKAIDTCAAAGGGQVTIPGGTFVSGALFLKDNIELHLSAGAVLRGSREVSHYPRFQFETHGYRVGHWLASLVTAVGVKNIAITGTGVIDGQGDVWWKIIDETGKDPGRPMLVTLIDCERVLVRDILATHSPAWTFRLFVCRNIVMDGVTVKNPWKQYRNNDAIDLVSCRDARITNCHIDTGDDGITLKTVPDYHMVCIGRPDHTKPYIPCENIAVENCIVQHAHGGVVIGSETVGGVRNVAVTNCVFAGTRSGVYVKGSQYGGAVENLQVSNVIMNRVELALNLEVNSAYGIVPRGPGDRLATIRNCQFQNITMERVCQAVRVVGCGQSPIRDIGFRGLRMEGDAGIHLQDAEQVRMDDVSLDCRTVPLITTNVNDLYIRGFSARPFTPELPVLQCERVRGAVIRDCTVAPGTGVFLGLVGMDNDIDATDIRCGTAQLRGSVAAPAAWNVCSHAFSGSRWIRDAGRNNSWLPASTEVVRFIRKRWTPEQVDGIFSISRVEANSRPGAEVETAGELRRIYIVEAWNVAERLVVFEDGTLLRAVTDPLFHAHYENRREDGEYPRILADEQRLAAGSGNREKP